MKALPRTDAPVHPNLLAWPVSNLWTGQQVTPAATGPGRVRFDSNVTGCGAEATHLTGPGAKNLGEKSDGGTLYTLLTGPDGNQIGVFDHTEAL